MEMGGEEKIKWILNAHYVRESKQLIEQMKETYMGTENGTTIEDDVLIILLNTSGCRWPRPVENSCTLTFECHAVLESNGRLTIHLHGEHGTEGEKKKYR